MKLPEGLQPIANMTKAEMLALLLREEYGYLPAAPYNVRYEVVGEDKKFCAGKAKLLSLLVHCETEQGSFTFPVSYTRPLKIAEPMPCFIHINFRDLVPDKYQPSEELVDSGVAVLSFCYKDVTSDDGDFTTGLAGVIYPNGRTEPTQCGKIGLWAWAAMRVMDIARTMPELDHSRICVAGHSRLGKTALLTGALDERFYCAFSNDSGCSGASISRAKHAKAETIRTIYERFPYWFCENYAKYIDREDEAPFDQHMLLAANAPHRVYVASAEEDLWADPINEYLSCVAASEYFKAQGMTGFVHPDREPQVGDAFHEGDIGYHLRPGTHYFSREDWQKYLKFLHI